MPIIQPNNTTGLYGVDTTVTINNAVIGNSLNISGNATIGGDLVVGGNITGNVQLTPPGSDGQVLYNNSGLLGAAAGLTYDDSNAVVGANTVASIGAVDLVLKTNGTATSEGNITITDGVNGNISINTNGSGKVNLLTSDLNFTKTTGSPQTQIATYQGSNLVLTTAWNLPFQTNSSIQIDWDSGSGQSANISLTPVPGRAINLDYSNVRVRGQTVGNTRFGGSMFVDDNVYAAFLHGNGSNITGITATASPAGSNTELQFNDGGSLGASANLTFNKTTNVLATTAITATGNITGDYFVGNGSLLTGIAASYGNAEVSNYLASGTNTANITTTGNVSGTYILGDGSQLTGLPALYGNTEVSNYLASGTNTANITTTGNIDGGNIITTGNIDGGNVNTFGLSATGNVSTSAFFIGDGSQLTNLPAPTPTAPGGNTTEVQFNNAGSFAGDSLFTWDTANAQSRIGNIKITAANNNIQNINAWDPNTTPQQARITVGTGYDGDFSITRDPISATRGAQLAVINKQIIGNADTNQSVRGTIGVFYADMNGATLTNANRRMQGGQFALAIGNGTQQVPATAPVYATAAGGGGTMQIGNITVGGSSTFPTGSTTLSYGTGALNNVLIGGNATVGNLVSSVNQLQFFTNNTGNVRTGIGTLTSFLGGQSGQPEPGNVYGYYMPGTVNNHGVTNSNLWRVADNYYFLMNEDDVAQNRLGSLRRYHEFNGVSGTTSGSLTIDKNAGQVQQVNLTGNVSSLAYSNFVTSASDGTNTDEQCDTVTIVFNQGSTGNYGVTFPTGADYKYAGNVTTLQSVAANSVSLVSVSAVRISGTTTYLTTISPGFV